MGHIPMTDIHKKVAETLYNMYAPDPVGTPFEDATHGAKEGWQAEAIHIIRMVEDNFAHLLVDAVKSHDKRRQEAPAEETL